MNGWMGEWMGGQNNGVIEDKIRVSKLHAIRTNCEDR